MTHALAQIQVLHKLPVIHGVFVFEKVKHARVRCLGKKHNRGTEAAQTALEMARVMKQFARLGNSPMPYLLIVVIVVCAVFSTARRNLKMNRPALERIVGAGFAAGSVSVHAGWLGFCSDKPDFSLALASSGWFAKNGL